MESISRVISQRFRGQASPGSSGGESLTATSKNPCRSTTVPSSSSSSFSSPLRRKPIPEKPRKELRKQRSADELQIRGGLWPSAKKHPANVIAVATLRDHLINESKNEVELEEEEDGRRPIVGFATHAASTFSSRQRSGRDSPANLENNLNNINMNMIGNGSRERSYRSSSSLSKKKKKKKKNKTNKKKQQQQPGGTPPSPSSSSCSSFSGPNIPSASRLPVDDNNENALSARRRRRRSEFGLDFPSSTEFDHNDSGNSRSRAPIKIAGKVIRGSGSPVRTSKSPVLRNSRSPPVLHNSRSPVLLRPRTPPSKVMIGGGMGNIINMGLMGSLFRRKSYSGAAQVTTESSPAKEAINGLSARRGVPEGVGSPARGSHAPAVLELQHKLRMEHNHLMQWRFINGRMAAVNTNKWATAQKELVSAWVGLLELQVAVTQKRLQLADHKLSFKLNTLISPQIKAVERWGNMEKHHMAAISSTKDCLHAVVCRLPLSDRAKADPQILSILLRKATNLMTAINGNIATCNTMAQRTVPLVAQLAQLVSKEKPLIEECFELLEFVSKLQLREESLRCHLIQLKS